VVVVGLIAVAALVVGIIGLTRPTSDTASKASTALGPLSTFTPDQVANAKKNLCTLYQVAAKSVKQDTNGTDVALARISTTNAAGILDAAADHPALEQGDRDTAHNLAAAYRNAVAISSVFDKTSPVLQQSIDDVNRLDGMMAARCP
jgi:hypothetical protein